MTVGVSYERPVADRYVWTAEKRVVVGAWTVDESVG